MPELNSACPPVRRIASRQNSLRERPHILRAFAQRRHGDAHDVEPVQQVVTEPPGFDLVGERPVRGRHDAGIDPPWMVLADAPDLAFLDRAQQLGLRTRREFADLVEKQRAAIRLLEQARAVGGRAGEGPARMSEQFRFEEVVAERGAVDGAEAAHPSGGPGVNRLGDEFLAGPALSEDEHRVGRRGGPANLPPDVGDGGAWPAEIAKAGVLGALHRRAGTQRGHRRPDGRGGGGQDAARPRLPCAGRAG